MEFGGAKFSRDEYFGRRDIVTFFTRCGIAGNVMKIKSRDSTAAFVHRRLIQYTEERILTLGCDGIVFIIRFSDGDL